MGIATIRGIAIGLAIAAIIVRILIVADIARSDSGSGVTRFGIAALVPFLAGGAAFVVGTLLRSALGAVLALAGAAIALAAVLVPVFAALAETSG